MAQSLYSQYWYRVADIRPRIRDHIQLHRHYYRGNRCYMLQDDASGAFHRFSPEVYVLIGQMDGKRTVDEIWESTLEKLADDAPSQEETLHLLGQLHAADILQCNMTPDVLEVFQRYRQKQRQDWKQRLMNPMSLRVPLWDPQQFLTRWLPWVRPLFSWAGMAVWSIVVLLGVIYAGIYWEPITADIIDRVLNPWNLVIMVLIYPFVKLLHEFGHAFTTRLWGGEVHELGIMFLVLMPVPYVDATASAGFQGKYRRLLVSAAGMMVELFLAALALFVWINVETGIVSAVAYNVMLIGSVSTLFFNGNPLLRFDGYYMLADAVEIPNLGVRSKRYLNYLAMRYLYGMQDVSSPVAARGEAAWFAGYGILSFLYRMFIMCVIILYVAGKFFVVGVLLAIWAVALQIIMPLVRHIGFLLRDGRLQNQRKRALGVTGFGVALVFCVLFMVPAPLWTMAEGVVWLPEQSRIRAGTDCFVTRVLAEPDSALSEGQPVLECEDPLLSTQVELLEARLQELRARHSLEKIADRVEAASIRQDILAVSEELDDARRELGELVMNSPSTGRLVIPRVADLEGKFVHRGDVLAYVINDATSRARVVVTQAAIGLVRTHVGNVEVRMASQAGRSLTAVIRNEVPAASNELPSKSLGTRGGGKIPVDPSDESGTRALATLFQFELEIEESIPAQLYGQRVYVRFDHGAEPIGIQWQRSLRQLFMHEFGV
jgi:putative peptide zinc metalloprotease protein